MPGRLQRRDELFRREQHVAVRGIIRVLLALPRGAGRSLRTCVPAGAQWRDDAAGVLASVNRVQMGVVRGFCLGRSDELQRIRVPSRLALEKRARLKRELLVDDVGCDLARGFERKLVGEDFA
jgi:hypothetical protein